MADETVKVLVLHPGAEKPLAIAKDDYKAMQALVGGTIAASTVVENLSLIYNDDGLLVGLPPNFRAQSGTLFVGTVILSRADDEGESVSVTDADEALFAKMLAHAKRYTAEYDIPQAQIATSFQELAAMKLPQVKYLGTNEG